MSSGLVLRGDLPAAAAAPRVVLRSQPAAELAEPAPAGAWITEQELAALKRQWMEQARAQGREEGLLEARDTAKQEAEGQAQARLERELKGRDEKTAKEQAEKWRGLATALADQLQALRAQLEAEVSEWTFVAAARLIGQQARDDVAALVQHVLAEAQLDAAVSILLHPQDLALVEAARATDEAGWPAGLAFMASDRVTVGGCLVQSPAQTLDARLEVQLAMLREALDAARHQRAAQEG